jgi:hypothetical protein
MHRISKRLLKFRAAFRHSDDDLETQRDRDRRRSTVRKNHCLDTPGIPLCHASLCLGTVRNDHYRAARSERKRFELALVKLSIQPNWNHVLGNFSQVMAMIGELPSTTQQGPD